MDNLILRHVCVTTVAMEKQYYVSITNNSFIVNKRCYLNEILMLSSIIFPALSMSLLPPKFSQGTCPFEISTQYLSLNTSLCTLRYQIITLFLFSDEARTFRKILHQQLLAMRMTFHLQQTLLT